MDKNKVNLARNRYTRFRANKFIEQYGTTPRFIAKQTGVNYVNFLAWLRGDKNFINANVDVLDEFITRVQQIAI